MSESCAECGRVDDGLKACKACKLVKYCNIDCQKAHWFNHKKACRKRTAELFDEQLFAKPPPRPRGECVICFLTMPAGQECTYMACCGKDICIGCVYHLTRRHCPYCNSRMPCSVEENNTWILERIEKYNDAEAMNMLGCYYQDGDEGFPVDYSKAVELFRQASELGCADAHYNLGCAYERGRSLERDMKQAVHHWQIAAMKGNEEARLNLGKFEYLKGNKNRAMRHCIISAKYGHDESLKEVREGFEMGIVSKNEYADTLRCHQAAQDETKSEQRDKAIAAQRGMH